MGKTRKMGALSAGDSARQQPIVHEAKPCTVASPRRCGWRSRDEVPRELVGWRNGESNRALGQAGVRESQEVCATECEVCW